MDRIHSQIIALTKSIYLVEPENVPGYMAQFTVGKPDPFSFLGGVGMTWWYTKTTFKIVENLAFMIIRDFKEFSGCDHEAVQNIIKQTLGEVCVDKRLFNEDDVCFARKKTLFLCKLSNDTKSYASIIADEIFSKLRNSLTNWCVVYAIPRLKGESFFIESEGIHVINKSDNDYWRSLDSKGFITNKWNPESGCYADGSITPFARYKYDYIIASEESGTDSGSRFSSSLKQKKLISVIFSIISLKQKYKLQKADAQPYRICLQFPDKTTSRPSIIMTEIGDLLPYYIKDHPLSLADTKKIKTWYESEARLNCAARNRIEKCAHFINHAMNSNDIESYINFFISIDALFGKRGAVEKSISEGISRLPQELKWDEKITWLFDLRNELIHGGSRYIKEWPKYMRYYRHFSSEPSDDIEKLSFYSLYYSPDLLSKSDNSGN